MDGVENEEEDTDGELKVRIIKFLLNNSSLISLLLLLFTDERIIKQHRKQEVLYYK